jgi:hypothetical protein
MHSEMHGNATLTRVSKPMVHARRALFRPEYLDESLEEKCGSQTGN